MTGDKAQICAPRAHSRYKYLIWRFCVYIFTQTKICLNASNVSSFGRSIRLASVEHSHMSPLATPLLIILKNLRNCMEVVWSIIWLVTVWLYRCVARFVKTNKFNFGLYCEMFSHQSPQTKRMANFSCVSITLPFYTIAVMHNSFDNEQNFKRTWTNKFDVHYNQGANWRGGIGGIFPPTGLVPSPQWFALRHPQVGYFLSPLLVVSGKVSPPLASNK